MKLYSKTGDTGETGLIGGTRVPKADARVACYGDVDELNACLGLVLSACPHDDWRELLLIVQNDLFVLGTQLATPKDREASHVIEARHVEALEAQLDEITATLPPLSNFVLPGGTELAARLHHARATCRRAERAVVRLAESEHVEGSVMAFLNRLSDLMFALALAANHRAGVSDINWNAT